MRETFREIHPVIIRPVIPPQAKFCPVQYVLKVFTATTLAVVPFGLLNIRDC